MGFCADGWLIWLLAIGSTTPRAALLLTAIAATVCFFIRLVTRIGGTASAAALLSLGITAIAYTVAVRFFPNVTFAPPIWIALAVLAGHTAYHEETRLPYHTAPTLLLVGILREILAKGSLWGLPLLPMELSPAFADGIGGWLTAALVLWCCRLHPPLFRPCEHPLPLTVLGGTVVLSSLIGLFTPTLPLWVTLWGSLTVCAVLFTLLPTAYNTDVLAVLSPLAAWWTHETGNRWFPLLLSVGAVTVVWGITTVVRYRRLYPTPRRFAGVPSALTVSALIYGLVTAF